MWLFSELPIGTCFQILMWFPKIFSLLLSINDPCLFPISRISAVQLFSTDDDKMEAAEDTSYTKPTKHEVLNCLAVHAKWVTTQHDMQVHVSQYGRRGRRERGREGRGLQWMKEMGEICTIRPLPYKFCTFLLLFLSKTSKGSAFKGFSMLFSKCITHRCLGGAEKTFACKSQECIWQDWYIFFIKIYITQHYNFIFSWYYS